MYVYIYNIYIYIYLFILSSSEDEFTHLPKEAILDTGMKAVLQVLIRKSLYFLYF